MRTIEKFKTLAFTILISFNLSTVFSQTELTQTVRGQIVDATSKTPLIGATIVVDLSQPLKGATTDIDGDFRLEEVPVGRHNFKVSYMGYEPYTASEILVSSGKEVVLKIELNESPLSLNEVVIRPNTNKDKPVSSMATLSARTFSVEETSRYAGGLDDPARLGHNTQSWWFMKDNDCIWIMPDFIQSLPIADLDNRELYISQGCAAQNATTPP